MSRGRFVTLEGGEGAGKTTQAEQLAAALTAAGIPTVRTREPGGAPGSELLRGILLEGPISWSPRAETLLHFAARAEHVARTIDPALAAGQWVVCDRFYDSTMAYQGYGQGADPAFIQAQIDLIGLRPDLTLVLDVPDAVAVERRRGRGGAVDRYERQDAAFHARVRAGFRAIAAAEPERCVLLDAAAGVRNVHERVMTTIQNRFCLALPQG
jgi:dTMP kinase